jgi:diadenosine tetraphosphate (Ap4A) HIT family hydrolase
MVDLEFVLHPQLAADSLYVADWPLCQLRLINDQHYPWFLLVPRVNNVKDIIDLTDEQQWQLWQESKRLSLWLKADYQPDKLNIAALGNVVPQLHLHHIARFQSDLAWPAPVWGKHPAQPYTSEQLTPLMTRWQQRIYF